MKENKLVDLSLQFAIRIVNLSKTINAPAPLANQLLRCGTFIGANIHEANYAHSRADFIAKLQIALKECYESDYWLTLFLETEILSEPEVIQLRNLCGNIRRILIASLNTAKSAKADTSTVSDPILAYSPFP